MGRQLFKLLVLFFAGLCLLPIFFVVFSALSGSFETASRFAMTVLPRFTWNTIVLALLVGIGTGIIGTAAAWLASTCQFFGRRTLELLLALPLAFPAYLLAYAYTTLLDHPGAVQSTLRSVTGWGPRDYWFPEIRSLWGAALMLTFVLYPYVYLLARAAFLRQSPTAYFAARTLGHAPWSAFWRVSLPVARPAIAGGVLLVLMETIADFGTVAHFGVQTFATGIYQAWFSMGDRAAASQLAFCLLMVALMLVVIERTQRGAARHFDAGKRLEAMAPHQLKGWRNFGAFMACALPVFLGFFLPVIVLFSMALDASQNPFTERYMRFITNSLTLASIAAVITVTGAFLVGYWHRLYPGRFSGKAKLLAGIGYAVPGGVIAVGLLVPFATLDNALDVFMRAQFGFSTGLLFTGSLTVLVLAYTVRFMAAAMSSFDTGMSAIKPNIDAVSRSLGSGPQRMLKTVHLPLMRASMLTGLLLVFVDTMKELPATLILRPFNFDTLAVQAYRLASDERLTQAAVPSLVIVAFGLLPVIVLCYTISKERPRHHSEMATPSLEPFAQTKARTL